MNYIGSKYSLLDFIHRTISDVTGYKPGDDYIFADLFAGTGVVGASYRKEGCKVISNDIQYYSYVINKYLIEGSENIDESLISSLDLLEDVDGFIFENYCAGSGSGRNYFTDSNGKKCDAIRIEIERLFNQNLISEETYFGLLAGLVNSIDKYANTASVYGAFLKHIKKSAQKQFKLELLPRIQGPKGEAYNEDVNKLITRIHGDVLYLDPPYTQNQYGTQYHLLETLILNDNPILSKITGSRPTTSMRAQWSKNYYAHVLFDKIIAGTKAKYVILSYNNDGFMSKDFIETTMKRYGIENSYICEIIDYKKYNNFKCQGADGHFEYLFFIEKKPRERVVIESPLNYTGSKSKMVGFIKSQLPKDDIDTFVDAFGGGFNVGVNINAKKIIYNDINPFVEGLIRSFYSNPCSYLQYIEKQIKKYNLSPDNKEGFLKLRDKYNSIPVAKRDPRMLYTLILYGFQQQIRFNSNWGFNNPAGSRWFNENLLSKFIAFTRSLQTKNVLFMNSNFDVLDIQFTPHTFIYADPPYRSTLGVYNDGKRGFEGWTLEHERQLCKFLDAANEHDAKFMLSYVVKVGEFTNTEIIEWTNKNKYHMVDVIAAQGRYNNRHEVLIKNY